MSRQFSKSKKPVCLKNRYSKFWLLIFFSNIDLKKRVTISVKKQATIDSIYCSLLPLFHLLVFRLFLRLNVFVVCLIFVFCLWGSGVWIHFLFQCSLQIPHHLYNRYLFDTDSTKARSFQYVGTTHIEYKDCGQNNLDPPDILLKS